MLDKVQKTIEKYGMLNSGDRVGVAVSGGPDSVALLKLLAMIAGDWNLELVILHMNHGIRGEESDRDESFVKKLGRTMEIAVTTKFVSIPGLRKKKKASLEDISREERYRFFREAAQSEGLNKVALGHNLNDQAETVIINFLRGSGMRGLKGMLPVRDDFYIRPLIEITGQEISSFLVNEDIESVNDSTNVSELFLRNRIRSYLIPELTKKYNPKLVEAIGQMTGILRHEDDFIRGSVEEIISDWGTCRDKDEITVDITKLVGLHKALQQRVIKVLLENYTPAKKGIGYQHVRSVVDLAEGQNASGVLSFPFCINVRREYGSLIFSKKGERHSSGAKAIEAGTDGLQFCCPVEIPGRADIPETGMSFRFDFIEVEKVNFESVDTDTVFMDYDAISPPLFLRNMKPGDRIQPIGMNGTKKLSEFFIDMKVPKLKRRKIPLLVDQKSVLWIPKMRLNQRVKITDMTEKVVKAKII
jgi:tRNA(Ile)-lysidine synthase